MRKMVSIVQHVLLGTPIAQEINWDLMKRLAKAHNLIPFLHASIDDTTPANIRADVYRMYYQNVGQMVQQKTYSERLFAAFDAESIPYLPLKGFALRELYPTPALRACFDLDILFKSEDRERVKVAMEQEGFRLTMRELHQDTYQKDLVTIEAHVALVEPKGRGEQYYKHIWSRLVPLAGSRYAFTDEDFYVYHLLHMFKHMKDGGCGVRSIIDIWLWNQHHPAMDQAYLAEQYKALGIVRFAEVVEAISRVWFASEELSEELALVESFIISGGAYGSLERHAHMHAATTSKAGSRLGYILRRLFPPRRYLVPNYPILERWPIFLPFCWIARIFTTIFSSKRKQIRRDLAVSSRLGTDATATAHRIREIIGDPAR